jgi:hypothetical protein
MGENELDLGFQPTLNIGGGNKGEDNTKPNEEITHLNGKGDPTNPEDVTGKDGTKPGEQPIIEDSNKGEEEKKDGVEPANPSTGGLEPNSQIEYDGQVYTVDENGNIVDDKGQIFKEAKDVEVWLKENEIVDETKETDANKIDIKAIQDAFGIEVTDEDGKQVEFTNDAQGLKSYVDSVIDIKSKDIQEATINSFLENNPLVAEFIDYVQVNNGSPVGFGTIPDRSKIQLNKDNEQQQEYIIRMAAKEFGNNSLNDNYIKYLKDSGGLYDEAKAQLEALVNKDKQVRENIAKQAEAQRKQEEEDLVNYWKNVNSIIENRNIAEYKLPESFTKEVDGKKTIVTPNDFFNYLTRRTVVDEQGNRITPYQRDLYAITEEEELNKDLLDAWLMFTGGTYKDLVDMAIKEDNVRKLRIKSKEQRTIKPIKIVKKANGGKVDINDIVL